MKAAIAIIDGTGDWDNGDYAVSMADSFCSQLKHVFHPHGHYRRGPSFEGYRIREKGVEAANFLVAQRTAGADTLLVAGYSRGGSCAIFAAEALEEMNIAVDGLLLFDPVARHVPPGGEDIPANVRFSRTVVRERDALLIARYEDTIPFTVLGCAVPGLAGNPMRPSFGNTGIKRLGPGDHDLKVFRGSHGALGGVGWSHVREDPACQIEVADYMSNVLKRFGATRRLYAQPIR